MVATLKIFLLAGFIVVHWKVSAEIIWKNFGFKALFVSYVVICLPLLAIWASIFVTMKRKMFSVNCLHVATYRFDLYCRTAALINLAREKLCSLQYLTCVLVVHAVTLSWFTWLLIHVIGSCLAHLFQYSCSKWSFFTVLSDQVELYKLYACMQLEIPPRHQHLECYF